MGIIIKTDLFPENFDSDLHDEEILEKPDNDLSKKYSLREIFLLLLTFSCGIAFGVFLTNFI